MGVKLYDNQAITGLTLSGTTDGTGDWNTVDLGSQLVGLPSDATGVLLRVGHEIPTAGYWAGVRTTGKTTPVYHALLAIRSQKYFFVPFQEGTKNIDFYLQNSAIVFNVVAALDATWHFFDIDAGLQNITGSGSTSTYVARTATGCPANSVVIMDGVRARPVGATGAIANAPVGMQVIPLDAEGQFEIATTQNTNKIYGYCDSSNTAFSSWMGATEDYTADNTWRTANFTASAGKKLLAVFVDRSTGSLDIQLRATGSTYTRSAVLASDNYGYSGVNAAGKFDYLIESTTTGPMYIVAQFSDYETYAVSISSIDRLVAGSISTIEFVDDYAATSVEISDGTTTKTASLTPTLNPAVFTFVCPDWVNGQTGLRYGNVSVVATDGVSTTASFDSEYQPPFGYNYVQATTVSYYNYGAAAEPPYSPELAIGTQSRFVPTHVTIGTDLQLESIVGFSGTTQVGDLDPTSRVVRLDTVTIEATGEDVAPVMPADTSVTVYEGTTTLITGGATSGTEPITYTLGGVSAALFSINSSTGTVTFNNPAVLGTGSITRTATNSVGSDTQTVTFSVVEVPEVGNNNKSWIGIGIGI